MANIELTNNQVKLLINGIDYMKDHIEAYIRKRHDVNLYVIDKAKIDIAELLIIKRKLLEGGDESGKS